MDIAKPVIGRASARPVGSPILPSRYRQNYDYDNCRAALVCEQHVMQLRGKTSPELAHFFAKNVVARCELFSEN